MYVESSKACYFVIGLGGCVELIKLQASVVNLMGVSDCLKIEFWRSTGGMIWLALLVLLLSQVNGKGAAEASNYLVGLGSYDITGPAADVNMMGYANTEQIASGIHFRLRARTFIVAEPQGRRVAFVNLDACMASQLVTIKVLERLKARYSCPP